MVARKALLPLALVASVSLTAVPAAHSGGDAPAMNPAVVGNAIVRTDKALSSAADFIDQGNGALAAKPLTASRRYLIRSYTGARYLIAHPPPPAPAGDGSANKATAASFRAKARRAVRRAHRGTKASSQWIRAHSSGG